MVINILFVLFIGNLFGILAARNIGYVLAHIFALSRSSSCAGTGPTGHGRYGSRRTGSHRLRSRRRVHVFEIVGIGWLQIAGGGGLYGANKSKVIGFSVLVISLLLFLFRRIVQDGSRHTGARRRR